MSCFKSGHDGAEVLAIIFIDKVKPHHRGRRISAEITATSWDSMLCHKILYRAAIHNRIKSLSWIKSTPGCCCSLSPFQNHFWPLASLFASNSVQSPVVLSVQRRASKAMDLLSVPLRRRTRQRRCCNSCMKMGLCQDKYLMLKKGDAFVLLILL